MTRANQAPLGLLCDANHQNEAVRAPFVVEAGRQFWTCATDGVSLAALVGGDKAVCSDRTYARVVATWIGERPKAVLTCELADLRAFADLGQVSAPDKIDPVEVAGAIVDRRRLARLLLVLPDGQVSLSVSDQRVLVIRRRGLHARLMEVRGMTARKRFRVEAESAP